MEKLTLMTGRNLSMSVVAHNFNIWWLEVDYIIDQRISNLVTIL